jgi:hypothetical protein
LQNGWLQVFTLSAGHHQAMVLQGKCSRCFTVIAFGGLKSQPMQKKIFFGNMLTSSSGFGGTK